MRATLLILPLLVSAASPLAAAEVVPVPAFRSIELRGGGSVVVRPGPAQVTIVEGSTQFTRFRVDEEGKLRIDACNDRCPRHYRLGIEVRYPTVLPMGVKGGGQITVERGFAPQREVALGVGGGGRIDFQSLAVETVAAGINGGGLIDLRSVTAETVAAGVNGGGKVMVGRSKTLTAGVSGGGEVRYAGDPRVTTVINGGGSVRPGQ
jgi:hypothetical protein